MAQEKSRSFVTKLKGLFGGKASQCVCREIAPGQWCCSRWDGGVLVQCPGSQIYSSKEECEASGECS